MRRADRLFTIVQLLRGGRHVTARRLGEQLQVSERTIYRDVDELTLCGVPIEGEAGRGYRLPKTFEIPPLMFERDEIEALVVGVRLVEAWCGQGLAARHARRSRAYGAPCQRRSSSASTTPACMRLASRAALLLRILR